MVFILLIYWVDNLTAKYYKKRMDYILSIRALVLMVPLITTGFMVTTLYSGAQLTKYETSHPANVDYLLRVNNPWAWQNRFEWDLHLTQLRLGISSENPVLIQEYINWAQQKAKQWPRPDLYQNLITAYKLLEQDQHAAQILDEAQYLYPGHQFALAAIEEAQAADSEAGKPAP